MSDPTLAELTPLLLLGGGGHCASAIDVIEAEGRFAVVGILDLAARVGEVQLGYPIRATDDDLPALIADGVAAHALVTLGQIKHPERRRSLYEALLAAGAAAPVVVSPLARVSPHATLGAGSIAMHGVIVNAGARVGVNAILNSLALIEHDAVVGDHCHVSTGARVNGGCVVGDGCFVGSGAVLAHGVTVADGCVIGAGAVVFRDTEPGATYLGNPARRAR